MKKVNAKAIVSKIKKGKPERVTLTFRLPSDLKEDFKNACDKQKVGQNQVIEELILEFIKNLNK